VYGSLENNYLEQTQNEAVMTWHLPEGNENIHKNSPIRIDGL